MERYERSKATGLMEAHITATTAFGSRPTTDNFKIFFRPNRSVDAQVRRKTDGVELDLGIPRNSLFVPKPGKTRKAHDRTLDMIWYDGQPDFVWHGEPNGVHVMAEFTNFA